MVTEGVLYRASEYAKQPEHAALVIVDEINRGPAAEVFGGSIVAMEGDRGLALMVGRRYLRSVLICWIRKLVA